MENLSEVDKLDGSKLEVSSIKCIHSNVIYKGHGVCNSINSVHVVKK